MSGIVLVNPEPGNSWMATSWVHDAVLRSVATAVEPVDPDLAGLLRAGTSELGMPFCDLSSLSPPRFALFLRVLEQTLQTAFTDPPLPGGASLRSLAAWSELLALSRTDPRASPELAAPAELRLLDKTPLIAPRWLRDLCVHLLAAFVHSAHPALTASLLAPEGEPRVALAPAERETLARAIHWFGERYGAGVSEALGAGPMADQIIPIAQQLGAAAA